MKRTSFAIILILVALLFSACGGGSGDTSGDVTVAPTSDANTVVQDTSTVVQDTSTVVQDTSTVVQDTSTVVQDTNTILQQVDLSWIAPTTRTDGSTLDPGELSGYKVYYGTSPDNLVLYEEIVGISETSTSVLNLTPGTYYFAVTAFDVDGLESAYSDVVFKILS